MKENNYQIAFSFASEDEWVAKDIDTLLQRKGFSSYCSSQKKDVANGVLREDLMDIYRKSTINILIYSYYYERKIGKSIVAMERKFLIDRHVRKNEEKSLFILIIDGSDIPNDFDVCLSHRIESIGIIGVEEYVCKRLRALTKSTDWLGIEYKHPEGVEGIRGVLKPCEFTIADNYSNDRNKRWSSLGDILVEPNTVLPRNLVSYLIPSAGCINFLSHSHMLMSDSLSLKIKKEAGKKFVKKNQGKKLIGMIFDIEKNGMYYPTIYCSEYDKFLNDEWDKYKP